MTRLLLSRTLLGLMLLPTSSPAASHTVSFVSDGRTVTYDIFDSGSTGPPTLIVLPGSSGPEVPFYRAQAAFFSQHGYRVLLLHYFDASLSRIPSDENYNRWATALDDLVRKIKAETAHRRIVLVGYSLGASVALAAGSQGTPIDAIAEWYGSLPDAFFHRFQTMPPLLILHGARDSNIPVENAQQLLRLCSLKALSCQNHIYPNQAHGFSDPDLADADERTLTFLNQGTPAEPSSTER